MFLINHSSRISCSHFSLLHDFPSLLNRFLPYCSYSFISDIPQPSYADALKYTSPRDLIPAHPNRSIFGAISPMDHCPSETSPTSPSTTGHLVDNCHSSPPSSLESMDPSPTITDLPNPNTPTIRVNALIDD